MKSLLLGTLRALACALLLTSCGGGGGIGGTGDGGGTGTANGSLRLSLTDAPACGYDAVNITIDRVRVHQDADASDSDPGWSEIVLAPPRRVDLLSLANGVLEELGQTNLPAGRYTQLRLLLVANGGGSPPANSVVPSGGSETALDTPSAQQSGLKLNVDIEVPAGQVADVVLDFDACKSIVKRGNSGHYNLKPVLSVVPLLTDAGLRVVGWVGPAIADPGTRVSLQSMGVAVKATSPDSTGRFVLYPVPVGSYDLVVTAAGHATAVMTGVPVSSTAYTYVNSSLLPIAPPDATDPARTVTGNVTPATATVRALQTLTGGPTVEVAWSPVDAASGDFGFDLVRDAPVRTAFVPDPVALDFVPDAGAQGLYSVEAASGGATQSQAVDTNLPVLPPLVFVFP